MYSTESILEMPNAKAVEQLRQFLLFHGAGVYLPRLTTRVAPSLLAIGQDQISSGRSVLELGRIATLPKKYADQLLACRGLVSRCAAYHGRKTALGVMMSNRSWASLNYDGTPPPIATHMTPFKEMFDYVEKKLESIINEIVSNYDDVVKELYEECKPLFVASYNSLIAQYRAAPKEYPQFVATSSSDGILPALNGEVLTEESFVNYAWGYVKDRIPTIDELKTKTKVYYKISQVPSGYYEPVGNAFSKTFDEDLKEASVTASTEFKSALLTLVEDVWNFVVEGVTAITITGRLSAPLANRTKNRLIELAQYVSNVNITEDAALRQVTTDLVSVISMDRENASVKLDEILRGALDARAKISGAMAAIVEEEEVEEADVVLIRTL